VLTRKASTHQNPATSGKSINFVGDAGGDLTTDEMAQGFEDDAYSRTEGPRKASVVEGTIVPTMMALTGNSLLPEIEEAQTGIPCGGGGINSALTAESTGERAAAEPHGGKG
jgi:hypothetical protein